MTLSLSTLASDVLSSVEQSSSISEATKGLERLWSSRDVSGNFNKTAAQVVVMAEGVVMHAWTYEEDADLPPKLAYIEIYLLEHTTLLQ